MTLCIIGALFAMILADNELFSWFMLVVMVAVAIGYLAKKGEYYGYDD